MRLRVGAVLVAAAALVGWTLLGPAQLGGGATYVTTHGNSMEPRFHTGDLAVLRSADYYDVGDVAAYHSSVLNTVVMHRIVEVDGDRYTFQGDNNSWLDPEQPTTADLIGRLAVRVPQGGTWIGRLTSPAALGTLTLALLATGGTTVHARRRRRRATMPETRVRRRCTTGATLEAAPGWWRSAAAGAAVVAFLGLALGAAAWTRPVTTQASSQVPVSGSMTFSYAAAVPLTPAYDGTTVTSPDPVFRKLADTVDVHFAYQGDHGTVTVTAELSTPSGWHSSVPLAEPTSFTTTRYEGTVRLDLAALEARAAAAAAVTGLPAQPLTVAVVPQVDTADGSSFAPTLRLELSPLQLTLPGGADELRVETSTTVQQVTATPGAIGVLRWAISVATARMVSALLLIAGLLAGAGLVLGVRRSPPVDEAAAIHRRYRPLLVTVHPMETPSGRPVVDVTEFATLARLAERFGLLVLHWSRGGCETFIVQDEGTTYRYRANTDDLPEPPSGVAPDDPPRAVRDSPASQTLPNFPTLPTPRQPAHRGPAHRSSSQTEGPW